MKKKNQRSNNVFFARVKIREERKKEVKKGRISLKEKG
jgi:hypothetical protein